MSVFWRLIGFGGSLIALAVFLVMGSGESLVVNFRFAVPIFVFLTLWLIGVVSEARVALEEIALNGDKE